MGANGCLVYRRVYSHSSVYSTFRKQRSMRCVHNERAKLVLVLIYIFWLTQFWVNMDDQVVFCCCFFFYNKWTVLIVLSQSSELSKSPQVKVHSPIHTHMLMADASWRTNIHTRSNWELFGVQYIAQGYFDMQTGGSRKWIANFPISGQPALTLQSGLSNVSKLYKRSTNHCAN